MSTPDQTPTPPASPPLRLIEAALGVVLLAVALGWALHPAAGLGALGALLVADALLFERIVARFVKPPTPDSED